MRVTYKEAMKMYCPMFMANGKEVTCKGIQCMVFVFVGKFNGKEDKEEYYYTCGLNNSAF